MDGEENKRNIQYNVLGGLIEICSNDPITGFYRDGCCNSGYEDLGSHTVCAIMNEKFLKFSKSMGNDLTTPRPEFGFDGLNEGDLWCLCAARWEEARKAGVAPRVKLKGTNQLALNFCNLEDLKLHAID